MEKDSWQMLMSGPRGAQTDGTLYDRHNWRVQFFGNFELTCDGTTVSLGPYSKAQAMIKYLLAHTPRPVHRRAVHRRDPHRDHLLVAGCRQVADRGDQSPRLSGAAGRRAAARARGDDRQPAGRRHVRHHQSAHHERPRRDARQTAHRSRRRHQAARPAARLLGLLQRQSRRGGGPDLRDRDRAHRDLRERAGAVPARSHQQRGVPEAAGVAGGRLVGLPARHRRHRPRHPVAAHLRRAAVAADRHRGGRDGDRRRASCSASSPASSAA